MWKLEDKIMIKQIIQTAQISVGLSEKDPL